MLWQISRSEVAGVGGCDSAIGRLRGVVSASVLVVFGLAAPGLAGAAATGVPAGWCSVANATTPGVATGAVAGEPAYVPTSCVPSPVWLAPYGGALGALLGATASSAAEDGVVVGAHGTLYELWGTGAATGKLVPSEVRGVVPSGQTVWHHSVATDASAPVGDSQVFAVCEGAHALIVDEATGGAHQVAPAAPPRPTGGPAVLSTTCAAVGDLVLVASAWVPATTRVHGAGGGALGLYTSAGRLMKRVAVSAAGAKVVAHAPWLGFAIAVQGTTAYVVYSNEPDGTSAGIYRITAQGVVEGPFAVPALATAAMGGSVLPLPGDRVLLDAGAPTATSNESHGALLAFFGPTPDLVWSRPIPGYDPVWDGQNLLTTGPQFAGITPELATVWVIAPAGGQELTAFAPGDDSTGLRILAAGPGGVLELATARTLPFGPPPCGGVCPPAWPNLLVLERLDGSVAWSVPLTAGALPQSVVLDMVGGEAAFVGGQGLAVAWGGDNDAASDPGAATGYTAAKTVPLLPTRPSTGVVGYAVVSGGRAVTAANPLVVTAAESGHRMELAVAAVNAAGKPVASPHAVAVRVSGPSGSGTLDGGPTALVRIAAGAASATVAYVPAKAGAYALEAAPAPPALPAPLVPAVIPAPGEVQVDIPYYDANGVPYPLPSGTTLNVVTNGTEVLTPLHVAAMSSGGVWTATFATSTIAIGYDWAFATQIGSPRGSVGSPSSGVEALVTASTPPALSASAGSGGVRLTLTGPSQSSGAPIGYAVYRVEGSHQSLPAGTAPLAIIDPVARRDLRATYLDPVMAGTYTYFAVALYGDASAGMASAGATVGER
jgi:hypothetical protein